MMNDEEVENFDDLESSMTRTGGMETGVEEHSAPQAGPGEDSAGRLLRLAKTAAATVPPQVAGSR
jgi:hypothetical protein